MSHEDRSRWDEKYSEKEISYTLRPDEWLVEMTADLQPGRVWEPACGMGHNAVWLAGQGWSVDAVDISPVALKFAKQLAEKHSLSVNWIAADLDDFRSRVDGLERVVQELHDAPVTRVKGRAGEQDRAKAMKVVELVVTLYEVVRGFRHGQGEGHLLRVLVDLGGPACRRGGGTPGSSRQVLTELAPKQGIS